jgi:hypothetical protein
VSIDELRKDKGYRRYASNVERALSLFDTALQEWADYISFLSRLLKVLPRPKDLQLAEQLTKIQNYRPFKRIRQP